jgi:hypothetical protein
MFKDKIWLSFRGCLTKGVVWILFGFTLFNFFFFFFLSFS